MSMRLFLFIAICCISCLIGQGALAEVYHASSTYEAYLSKFSSSWEYVIDYTEASSGPFLNSAWTTEIFNSHGGGGFNASRSFQDYDLSAIPFSETVVSANLKFWGSYNDMQSVCTTTADEPWVETVSVLPGVPLGGAQKVSWASSSNTVLATPFNQGDRVSGVYNSIPLNVDGIQYLQDSLGGSVQLSLKTGNDLSGHDPPLCSSPGQSSVELWLSSQSGASSTYLEIVTEETKAINLFPPNYPTMTYSTSGPTLIMDVEYEGNFDNEPIYIAAEYWNASSSCPLITDPAYDTEARHYRWKINSTYSIVQPLGPTTATSTVTFNWPAGGKYNCFHAFFMGPVGGTHVWTSADDVLNIKPTWLEILRPPYGAATSSTSISLEDLPGFSAQFDRTKFYQDHLPLIFYANSSTTPPTPTIIYDLITGIGEIVMAPAAGLLGKGYAMINNTTSANWASSSSVSIRFVVGLVGAIGLLSGLPIVSALIVCFVLGFSIFVLRWFLRLLKIIH